MTLLRSSDILMLTLFMMATTAKRIVLDRKGGNILIISNSTSRRYVYNFPGSHWNYDVMAKVVISVGHLSKADVITLTGFGTVKKTSCFFMVQRLSGVQRLFSNSCSLDEAKVRQYGCEVVKDLRRLKITIRTAPSLVKKNLLYISYSLHACNADTNVTTKAPSFFTKGIDLLSQEQSTSTTNMPSYSGDSDLTTVADDAKATNCLKCDGDHNTVTIAATISGTVVVIIIAIFIIRCRHNSVPKKESTASSTISSIRSPSPSAYTVDEIYSESSVQRLHELPEKYIFSPPAYRRPFEFPKVEVDSDIYSTPHSPPEEQDTSSFPVRLYDQPLQTVTLRTSLSSENGIQTEETAFAYAVSPVVDHSKQHIEQSFSATLTELLNSRPIGDDLKNAESERDYVNYTFPRDAHRQISNEEEIANGPATSDPHDALYHIILNGTESQHPYDIPESSTTPSGYAVKRAPRRTKPHDYVNVLPNVEEENEQCYEKMEDQNEHPRKPPRIGYVSMANILGADHSALAELTEAKD